MFLTSHKHFIKHFLIFALLSLAKMTRALRILNSSQNITAVVTAVAPPPEDVEEERELHANLFLAAFGIVFSCLAILWLKLCTGPRIFPSSPSSFDRY
jgi:hypothetical protein